MSRVGQPVNTSPTRTCGGESNGTGWRAARHRTPAAGRTAPRMRLPVAEAARCMARTTTRATRRHGHMRWRGANRRGGCARVRRSAPPPTRSSSSARTAQAQPGRSRDADASRRRQATPRRSPRQSRARLLRRAARCSPRGPHLEATRERRPLERAHATLHLSRPTTAGASPAALSPSPNAIASAAS